MNRYVALLRGINVGGNNLIKMTALKACFEAQGFEEVSTFIASGNVLFTAGAAPVAPLRRRLEATLSKTFGYQATLVLRSQKQMREVVARAPRGFGTQPAKYRYTVVFLKEPLTAAAAIREVATKPGVDEVYAGRGVLYFSRLDSKATQSRLNKIVASPIYPRLTIRNWSTTTQIARLLETPRG